MKKYKLGRSLLFMLLAGTVSCSGEQGYTEEMFAVNRQNLTCRPNWILADSGRDACYVDRDTQIYGYKLEVYTADRYADINGCYPDSYSHRLLDTIRCEIWLPEKDCLSAVRPPRPPVGRDLCPRPRKNDFYGTITANPVSVLLYDGESVGSSNICWDTGLDTAQVWVSCTGEPEKLFAAKRKGCSTAGWITAGNSCTFTIYDSGSRRGGLADVVVAGIRTSGPRPCRPGSDRRCDPDMCWPSGSPCP